MEDSFSTDSERGWFRDDLSALHLLCILFLLLLHQLHLRSSGFGSQRLGTPCLSHTLSVQQILLAYHSAGLEPLGCQSPTFSQESSHWEEAPNRSVSLLVSHPPYQVFMWEKHPIIGGPSAFCHIPEPAPQGTAEAGTPGTHRTIKPSWESSPFTPPSPTLGLP